MSPANLDDEIARLYQLPLAEFTATRNVLAKRSAGRAADVRALQKPSVAAWAVNQVHWQDRPTYDRLIAAAGDARAAHAAVLSGAPADVRAAGKSHEEAITAASRSAVAILRDSGQPPTDATRQAIVTTLRALPGQAAPGQLSGTLQPGGLEMLAGLHVQERVVPSPAPGASGGSVAASTRLETRAAPRSTRSAGPDPAAQRRAKAEAEEADRAVRLAEHAAHREAFEAARTGRQAEKAGKALAEAREAVAEAERGLAEAARVSADAAAAQAAAAARASEADAALERAVTGPHALAGTPQPRLKCYTCGF